MNTRTQQRAAIAHRIGQLLRTPGFRKSLPHGIPIIVVLPDDPVSYLMNRLAEYPGDAMVATESGQGLVMTTARLKHVDG